MNPNLNVLSEHQAEQDTAGIAKANPAPRRGWNRLFHTPWLVRFGLICFGLVAACVVFEIGFRVFSPLLTAQAWRDLPKEYYIPEGSGMDRDFAYSVTKPPNTYRIVVVGDSFIYGGTMQLFDTFPKRLERYLNLNLDQPKVEVINYSAPGTATLHQQRMVSHAVKHYDPDLILLEITLNDPEPKPYSVDNKSAIDKFLKRPIFDYWKSMKFLITRIQVAQDHWKFRNYYQDIFDDSKKWGSFKAALGHITRQVENHHVRFGAVIFPLFSHPMNEQYPFWSLHEKLHGALESLHVPYLDLFQSYTNIPTDRLQAIPGRNDHPSELANRIAADEIYRWLVRQQLIPPKTIVKRTRKDRVPSAPLSLGDNEPMTKEQSKVL